MDDLYRLAGLSREASDADISRALKRLDRSLAARVKGILLVPRRRRAYDNLLATHELHQELRRKLIKQHSGTSYADSMHSSSHTSTTPSGESSSKSSTTFRRFTIGIVTTALIICFRYAPQIYREIFPQRIETYTSSYDYSSQEPPTQPPAEPASTSSEQSVESNVNDQSMIEGDEEESDASSHATSCLYIIYTYECFADRSEATEFARTYISGTDADPSWDVHNVYDEIHYTPTVRNTCPIYVMLDETYDSLDECISRMKYLQFALGVDLQIACFLASDSRGRTALEFVYD